MAHDALFSGICLMPDPTIKSVIIDWCDGPLTELALVDVTRGWHDQRIELRTNLFYMDKENPGSKYRMVHVRMDRAKIQQMLDLYDGKEVKAYDEG